LSKLSTVKQRTH